MDRATRGVHGTRWLPSSVWDAEGGRVRDRGERVPGAGLGLVRA
jgi:hypothetical protein